MSHWRADRPWNDLPKLPPKVELESKVVLKQRVSARAALAAAGVLREQAFGKEKLFVHPKLMNLLTRDANAFESYRA
ncbi:MAG TPA: hypothetical protein VNF69_08230 [Burkholderiales bacterium]|nr:hypothetical protein [Burkholderiales bacterium]